MHQILRFSYQWVLSAVAFLLIVSSFSYARAGEVVNASTLPERELRLAVAIGPKALDGILASGAASTRLLRLIAPPLFSLNEAGEVDFSKGVAQSITTEGEKAYVIELKPLVFHDGEPLRASHIVSLFEKIREEGSTSPLKGYFQNVETVSAEGERAVRLLLKEPSPWFYSTLENVPIVKVDKPSVGLGTYRLTSLDSYGNVTLTRQDGAVFKFVVVKDPMVRLLKLMRGEVDVVHSDIPSELYEYGLSKGFKGVAVPSNSYTYIGFNLEAGVQADLAVRQAISLAIDRPLMIEALLGGRAAPALSLLLPSHKAFKAMSDSLIAYDPKRAIEILESAGYHAGSDGVRLHLKMCVTTNPFVLRLAQALQQQLETVGIALDISSLEWGAFYDHIKKGNFESYILSWVGRFQPDFYRYVFHSDMMPPAGANRGRLQNADMDKALDALMVEMDEERSIQLAHEVQDMQNQQMLYVPLWRGHHVALSRPDLIYVIQGDGGYSGLDTLLR